MSGKEKLSYRWRRNRSRLIKQNWYTQSVPNSSKNKGELETSKIVKSLMKRVE